MTDTAQAPFIAKRWIILLVLFLARTVMAYQFQTVGALGLILVDALKIDFVWLGTLIGLYMLPGAVFALPGGLLGQRYGAKNVVLVGLALMVADICGDPLCPQKADIPQRTDTFWRGIVACRDGAGTGDHTHRNMGREIGSLSL